jgi:transcriptional regulator with XRE-family HTH domain
MSTLGRKVREFREHPDRGWSTRVLAEKVGTTRQSIENLEAGSVGLPHYLVQLADVMDVSLDALLDRSPNRRISEPAPVYRLHTLEDSLRMVGQSLAAAPDEYQRAIADNLASWARDRGADHYIAILLTLLQRTSSKQLAMG